jgi:hypothetical protein
MLPCREIEREDTALELKNLLIAFPAFMSWWFVFSQRGVGAPISELVMVALLGALAGAGMALGLWLSARLAARVLRRDRHEPRR